MTPTICSLVSIEYHVRYSPPDLPPTEKHRQRALLAIRHLSGLGLLLAELTSDSQFRSFPDYLPKDELSNRQDNLDTGLHVLGSLVSAIAQEVLSAVEEIAEEMEAQDDNH